MRSFATRCRWATTLLVCTVVWALFNVPFGLDLPAAEAAPAVETQPAELLGTTALTVNGRVQPHGLPTSYYFEYGPTPDYGQRTPQTALPPKLAAYFRTTWDDGWNGWMSWDSRLQHFAEGGASRGYIRYSGCPRDDHNHDDGIGTVHLAQYMYPGRLELSVPSAYLAAGDPDFRDAKVKIAVRGVEWQPHGTELMWWSQSQSNIDLNPDDHTLHPAYIHANWCFTATNLTELLRTGNWERAEYRLTNDSHAWSYCGNNKSTQARYRYWSIDETQRHLNLDLFHMVVFVDPNDRPTGSIDFDEFEVTYRNYSLAHPANGGRLVASPAGSHDDPAALTDGWRNGEGKTWRSGPDPVEPLEFVYEFDHPITINAVQIHQHPDWPSREVEVLVSDDGQNWKSLLKRDVPEKHPAGANYAFLLARGLDAKPAAGIEAQPAAGIEAQPAAGIAAPARRAKVRIVSGYRAEHWGLGEIEVFGTGAVMLTDDDWYHVNVDIGELAPGETYHYRLVAVGDAGMTAGEDHVVTLPADPRPQVVTGVATRVAADTAKIEGRLNAMGQRTDFYFEYGIDASYGQRSPSQYGGLQITPRTAFATLMGLQPDTQYHYRLVATNETGASKGDDATFRTRAER